MPLKTAAARLQVLAAVCSMSKRLLSRSVPYCMCTRNAGGLLTAAAGKALVRVAALGSICNPAP